MSGKKTDLDVVIDVIIDPKLWEKTDKKVFYWSDLIK